MNKSVLTYIIAQVTLLVLIGVFIYNLTRTGGPNNEGVFALVLVFAVAFLMTTLFVLASAFKELELADSNQPLGLPAGSIRSMIALILILVFIMFGAFVYSRELTQVNSVGPVQMPKDAWLDLDDVVAAWPSLDSSGTPIPGRYDVYFGRDRDDSSRIAQQLLTTVGTLVVAVAGFYFGSSNVVAARRATNGAATASSGEQDGGAPSNGGAGDESSGEAGNGLLGNGATREGEVRNSGLGNGEVDASDREEAR